MQKKEEREIKGCGRRKKTRLGTNVNQTGFFYFSVRGN